MNFAGLISKVRSNQFLNDSFWALTGNVVGKGLSLAGAVVVARFLGKDIYGEYGAIRNTIINIAIFSTFGLGYTATKYIAEYKDKHPQKLKLVIKYSLRLSFLLSFVLALALFIFSDYIAENILEAGELSGGLRITSLWIVFNALTTAQVGILSGFGAYKAMARINTISGVFAFLSSLILTYFFLFEGALISLLVTQILNWTLNFLEVRRNLPKQNLREDNDISLKEILKFSFPIALQEATYSVMSWLLIYIILIWTDYGQVGLYSAAMQWTAILLFIPGIMRNVILTHLSKNSDDPNAHAKILRLTLIINLTTTLVPFLIIYFLKSWVVSFYGTSFKNGLEEVLSIALFSVIFSSLTNVYSQAFLSIDRNWLMFSLRLVRETVIIGVSWYLLSNHIFTGATSVVVGLVIGEILIFVSTSLIYRRIIRS